MGYKWYLVEQLLALDLEFQLGCGVVRMQLLAGGLPTLLGALVQLPIVLQLLRCLRRGTGSVAVSL